VQNSYLSLGGEVRDRIDACDPLPVRHRPQRLRLGVVAGASSSISI
jgi:hypothetical protein